MADTAAFFANKKKKKKAFKFNANKINLASATTAIHVDAPALSSNDASQATDNAVISKAAETGTDGRKATHDQWDDEALAASMSKKTGVAAAGPATTAELLDMKSLDLKRDEEEDIAEKLRIEETKKQLAAAKEGMEKEAQRIKDEKEKKDQAQTASAAAKPNRWLPAHARGGGLSGSSRFGLASKMSQKLDTQSEELFPDLASASKIIEEQKQQQPAYKAPKKTPVGGGATWGSRPKLNLTSKKVSKPPTTDDAAAPDSGVSKTPASTAAASTAAAPSEPETKKEEADKPKAAADPEQPPAAAAPVAPIKPKKKKKKKDLSTFKPKA